MDDGKYCISLQLTFETIPFLISHYIQQADSLCQTLKMNSSHFPLQQKKYIPRWHIDRQMIKINTLRETYRLYEVWDGTCTMFSKGRWNDSPVSLRTLRKGFMCVAKFFEEVELMKKLHHKNIIELLGINTQETPLYMITEHIQDTLQVYLIEHGHCLKHYQLINIGEQVALAMTYLGKINCVHRNLCAKSIVLTSYKDITCKVTDFSYAKIISQHGYVESTAQESFPVKWTAPESLSSKRFTIESDVWSFGIVLYELISCSIEPYYPGMDEDDDERSNKLFGIYNTSCPNDCTAKLYQIVMKCQKYNPDDRPYFSDIHFKLVQQSKINKRTC